MSRDPRASATMDTDIRTFTIRDPRANSNNAAATAASMAATTTATAPPPQLTQMPPQAVQPSRPPVAQQQLPQKPVSSTDNEKVISLPLLILFCQIMFSYQ